jgi:hypothetical protein
MNFTSVNSYQSSHLVSTALSTQLITSLFQGYIVVSVCYTFLIFLFVVCCSAFVKVAVLIQDIDATSILLLKFTYFIFFLCLVEKDTRLVPSAMSLEIHPGCKLVCNFWRLSNYTHSFLSYAFGLLPSTLWLSTNWSFGGWLGQQPSANTIHICRIGILFN